MKRFISLPAPAIVIVFALFSIVLFTGNLPAKILNRVIVRINEEVVLESEVDEKLIASIGKENVKKLEKEQVKLAKELEIKDKIDFSLADKFGAISTTFLQNKLLCCIIICNKDYEIIDRAYFKKAGVVSGSCLFLWHINILWCQL